MNNSNPNQPNTRPCAPDTGVLSGRMWAGAATGAMAGAKYGTPMGIVGGATVGAATAGVITAFDQQRAMKKCLDEQASQAQKGPKP